MEESEFTENVGSRIATPTSLRMAILTRLKRSATIAIILPALIPDTCFWERIGRTLWI